MNLKTKISFDELNVKLKTLAQKERELLHEILMTIKEIELNRGFLKLGFSSLFDYLTKHIGYSEGAAQRRIDAARLVREIPELSKKIQSGEVNLSQISILQKAVRQVQKFHCQKVTTQEKTELLNKMITKNHSETQKAVAEYFDLPVIDGIKQTRQSNNSVRLELTLSQEQFEKLQQAKDLLSHVVPSGDLAQVIEYLSNKVIQQKTGSTTATVAVKTISTSVRRHLFQKQACCQYQDPQTKQKCQSKWQLQVDHIQPKWAGGSNELENLRLLCGKHNRELYRWQVGIE